jgi:hypothetical protein
MMNGLEVTPMKTQAWPIIFTLFLLVACSGSGKQLIIDATGQEDSTVAEDVVTHDNQGQDHVSLEVIEDVTDTSSPDLPLDIGTDGDGFVLPEMCCFTDDDCPAENVCVGYDGGLWPEAGACQPIPDAGRCWDDDDCTSVEDLCHMPVICGCLEKCAMEPGWCLHTDPPNCCHDDDSCADGQLCVGKDMGMGGVCLPEPEVTECYYNSNCEPGEYCISASICSCDMNCISETGVCLPLDVNCCFGDDDCEVMQQCVDMGDNDLGVCKSQPPLGLCWHDQHCQPGFQCQWPSICPCDADCDGVDMPGECQPVCGESDCCCEDDECGDGNVCVYIDNGNACLPEQPDGMCWQDSHCGEQEYCQGAVPCPCSWDCDGDGWDIPGTCKGTGGDMCCMTDMDCPQFYNGKLMFCLIEEGNPFVVGTCQPMASPGKCWSEADCYMLQTCKGSGFCPCGMDCQAPGTTMGDCTPLPESCCYDDFDCTDGTVCRGTFQEENMPGRCVPDPNGPECLFDAQCCWNNADCAAGSACKNVSICGCIELCPVCGDCQPDQMGVCE